MTQIPDGSLVPETGSTTAPPVRMPAGFRIPQSTGDPLQDAADLRDALAQLINRGISDAGQRQAATTAYQAASDDWARLYKERLAANAAANAAPDPTDVAWKRNLDRLEQQDRINKLSNPPDATPAISTTARQIWGKREDGTMGWVDNPNYTPPTPPQGPAFSGTKAGMDYKAILDKDALDKAVERDLRKLQLEYEAGYKELPAAQREAAALVAEARAQRDQIRALEIQERQAAAQQALAAEQSRLRTEEFDKNERPFKEADLRLRGEAAHLQRSQAQAAALTKQGEQGQALIQQGLAAGVAPPVEVVRMAYSPIQAALKILNTPWQPEQQQVTAPQPQAPTIPAPTMAQANNMAGSGLGGVVPRAPVPR